MARKKAIEIGGGSSADGIYGYAGYVYFFPQQKQQYGWSNMFIRGNKYEAFPCKKRTSIQIPHQLSAKLSAFYEQGNGNGVRYRIIGVDGSLLYTVIQTGILDLNIKGGVTISNDALITPLQEENDINHYNRFKYGILGGCELALRVGVPGSLSIITGADQRYLFNRSDSWGNERWYAFAGLRFKIPRGR